MNMLRGIGFSGALLLTMGLMASAVAQTIEGGKPAYVSSPVAVSNRIDTLDGRAYRVHVVQSGHTLYSIARAYQVKREDILKKSGGDTIRLGEALYIPLSETVKPDVATTTSAAANNRATSVAATASTSTTADTSAAKPMQASPLSTPTTDLSAEEPAAPLTRAERRAERRALRDSLLLAKVAEQAGLLTDSLFAADTLPPLYFMWGRDTIDLNQVTTDSLWQTWFNKKDSTQSLTVALLLPLQLNDTANPPVRSFAYLPFLEGFLTAQSEAAGEAVTQAALIAQAEYAALSSVRPQTPSVRYIIKDVTDKPESVNKALKDPAVAKADLFLAAVYTKVFDTILRFAQARQIPVVHPLTEQDSMAVNHPFYVQRTPSYESQASEINRFVKREFMPKRYRYVIFDDSSTFFRKRAAQLSAQLLSDSTLSCEVYQYSLSPARMSVVFGKVFDTLFSVKSAKPTVFIGCTDKEIALLNTFIALKKCKKQTEKIFIGPASWMNFTKIEPEYFKNIRLLCYQPLYWDKTSEASLRFERHYYQHFDVVPNDMAYKGYTCHQWLTDMLQNRSVATNSFERNHWQIRSIFGWENTRLYWLELKGEAFQMVPEPEVIETPTITTETENHFTY